MKCFYVKFIDKIKLFHNSLITSCIISLIQNFEDDFQWKVILKIMNSGTMLKTFTHDNVCKKYNMDSEG